MPYQHNHRTAAASHQPPMADADLDAFLIDDEFEDSLDRHIAAIHESLADYRNV